MDQVVRAAADKDEFSGSVLVARDGQILLDRGYGLANREWSIPNDSATRFRLGSVTKQFTAVAIMLLNERGQVDLDAPVKTYLPNAPAAWDRMTVRHLLTHSSGLYDHGSDPRFTQTLFGDPKRRWSREDLVRLSMSYAGPQGAPGEKFLYSDTGYILLGDVIERDEEEIHAVFLGGPRMPERVRVFLDFVVPRLQQFLNG